MILCHNSLPLFVLSALFKYLLYCSDGRLLLVATGKRKKKTDCAILLQTQSELKNNERKSFLINFDVFWIETTTMKLQMCSNNAINNSTCKTKRKKNNRCHVSVKHTCFTIILLFFQISFLCIMRGLFSSLFFYFCFSIKV